MPKRRGQAQWRGGLKQGSGTVNVEGGALENASYSAGSRFGDQPGTNPEELIGAAHAGCFSMAFALGLEEAGFTPETIDTTASVTIEEVPDGFSITSIHLDTTASVANIDEARFQEVADEAKKGCPVSKALAGVGISLEATLKR